MAQHVLADADTNLLLVTNPGVGVSVSIYIAFDKDWRGGGMENYLDCKFGDARRGLDKVIRYELNARATGAREKIIRTGAVSKRKVNRK